MGVVGVVGVVVGPLSQGPEEIGMPPIVQGGPTGVVGCVGVVGVVGTAGEATAGHSSATLILPPATRSIDPVHVTCAAAADQAVSARSAHRERALQCRIPDERRNDFLSPARHRSRCGRRAPRSSGRPERHSSNLLRLLRDDVGDRAGARHAVMLRREALRRRLTPGSASMPDFTSTSCRHFGAGSSAASAPTATALSRLYAALCRSVTMVLFVMCSPGAPPEISFGSIAQPFSARAASAARNSFFIG
jgi:hypothetical protein